MSSGAAYIIKRNRIIEKHHKLVYYFIRKFFPGLIGSFPFEDNDLFQEGFIAFMDALKSYKRHKGSISNWVGQCIRSRILNYIRSHRKIKDCEVISLPLDDSWEDEKSSDDFDREYYEQVHDKLIFEDKAFTELEGNNLAERLMQCLSEKEKTIIKMKFGLGCFEWKNDEIADHFDMPSSKVSLAIARSIEKMGVYARMSGFKNSDFFNGVKRKAVL